MIDGGVTAVRLCVGEIVAWLGPPDPDRQSAPTPRLGGEITSTLHATDDPPELRAALDTIDAQYGDDIDRPACLSDAGGSSTREPPAEGAGTWIRCRLADAAVMWTRARVDIARMPQEGVTGPEGAAALQRARIAEHQMIECVQALDGPGGKTVR